MTNVVNHLQLPVIADVHVVALGTRQLVPVDGIGRVRVAGRVAGGAGQVLQLVKPLPLDLQPDRLDELGERPVDVIVGAPAGDVPLDHLRVAVDPRVPLASAKQKLIVRPLLDDNAKRLDRLGPQRQEVLGARLAAPVLQPLAGEVGLRLGQLRQLLRPETAVERQQDHRLRLLPRRSAPRDASRDQLIDAGQDAPDVGGLVQRPIHRRRPAARELADGLLPKVDCGAPVMIGGVSAGVAKVCDRPLGGVDPVSRGDPAVDVRGIVGGQLVDRPLTGHSVNSLPAAAVLAVGVESNLPPFGVSLSDQQPAIEDIPQVDDRAGRHGLRLRRRRSLGQHGRALAVVLPQRGLGRDLPSNPAGAASNSSLVPARVDGQRRVRRQLRGPVHANPLAQEIWRSRMARPVIPDSGSENKAPPARGRRRKPRHLECDRKPLATSSYRSSPSAIPAGWQILIFSRFSQESTVPHMARYGARSAEVSHV